MYNKDTAFFFSVLECGAKRAAPTTHLGGRGCGLLCRGDSVSGQGDEPYHSLQNLGGQVVVGEEHNVVRFFVVHDKSFLGDDRDPILPNLEVGREDVHKAELVGRYNLSANEGAQCPVVVRGVEFIPTESEGVNEGGDDGDDGVRCRRNASCANGWNDCFA